MIITVSLLLVAILFRICRFFDNTFCLQVTLEGRAGALAALHSLLVHCPSLVHNDDTAKRLQQPIDGAIAVLTK